MVHPLSSTGTGRRPFPPKLFNACMVNSQACAHEHGQKANCGERSSQLPKQRDGGDPDHDRNRMWPALPETHRTGSQPCNVLKSEGTEQQQARSETRQYDAAIDAHQVNTLTATNPPTSRNAPAIARTVICFSISAFARSPKYQITTATPKNCKPRPIKEAPIRTQRFRPVTPEKIVTTLYGNGVSAAIRTASTPNSLNFALISANLSALP